MTIRSRISSIERIVERLFPTTDTCRTCGGPCPGINRVVLCEQKGDEVVAAGKRCPECGLAVDEDGRATDSAAPVRRYERAQVKRIILSNPA